jgi:hypothetical protein
MNVQPSLGNDGRPVLFSRRLKNTPLQVFRCSSCDKSESHEWSANLSGMTFEEFRDSLREDAPPRGLNLALKALWWDGKGEWERAHESAQKDEGPARAWVRGSPDRALSVFQFLDRPGICIHHNCLLIAHSSHLANW